MIILLDQLRFAFLSFWKRNSVRLVLLNALNLSPNKCMKEAYQRFRLSEYKLTVWFLVLWPNCSLLIRGHNQRGVSEEPKNVRGFNPLRKYTHSDLPKAQYTTPTERDAFISAISFDIGDIQNGSSLWFYVLQKVFFANSKKHEVFSLRVCPILEKRPQNTIYNHRPSLFFSFPEKSRKAASGV